MGHCTFLPYIVGKQFSKAKKKNNEGRKKVKLSLTGREGP
jgi:hypothetical protein